MAPIIRQLKTLSGGILGLIVMLIVAFFVLNLIQTRGGPAAGVGGWLFQHASGEAYSGGTGPASPAMATSAYSANSNLGPML